MPGSFHHNVTLALARIAEDASFATDAEDALWLTTRMLPSLLGDPQAVAIAGNLPQDTQPGRASAAFMKSPDGQYHLVTAPVNFQPEQYHQRIPIALGHPGHVAQTKRALLLRDTSHHDSFVKILQTFRAGSALQIPMLWRGDYLGVIICASSVRNTFSETDLQAMRAFAGLAAAIWMAHGGPAWMAGLDWDSLPLYQQGN